MSDEINDIAEDGTNDWTKDEKGKTTFNNEHHQRSRLRVDTRKWLLSKALPKIYGDKVVQEHVGKDGGPIQTESKIDVSKLAPEERSALKDLLSKAVAEEKDDG